MSFCTSFCRWLSVPCVGISPPSGKILQKLFLPVPVVCTFQQRLCRGKIKSTRPVYASGMVRKGRDHLGQRNRRRDDAPGIGDRLPHPDWNHPVANDVILFQCRHHSRQIVDFPCHADIHMVFSTAACCSVWPVFRQRFAEGERWPTNLRGS